MKHIPILATHTEIPDTIYSLYLVNDTVVRAVKLDDEVGDLTGIHYPAWPPSKYAGKYRHYKNRKIYTVLGVAICDQTKVNLMIYSDEEKTWARPLDMFLEFVEHNGRKMPRFSRET